MVIVEKSYFPQFEWIDPIKYLEKVHNRDFCLFSIHSKLQFSGTYVESSSQCRFGNVVYRGRFIVTTVKQSALDFESLQLLPNLLSNLTSLGYRQMTPIQAESLPFILEGHDVIGQGKTGSGKTAAFGLGLLNKLDVKRFRIQSLVLCPTRELADQVAKEIRRLGRAIHNIKVLTLCGGMPLGPQIGSLEHGAHIIVGTPGRIEEHLRKGTLQLNDVNTLVLDEADRMLDMGFQASLDNIVESIPRQRQTLLFSATFPDAIEEISMRVMRNPQRVQLQKQHSNSVITQEFYQLDNDNQRDSATIALLLQYQPVSAVVFCKTKKAVQALTKVLDEQGFYVLGLHGDLEQRDRDQALVRFANKSVTVLVATDVAARGLDIEAIDLVINYQLAHDAEVHIHRIGRSGRAGQLGRACSLYTSKEEYQVAQIQDSLGETISPQTLPNERELPDFTPKPSMITLLIDGGKKQKLRAGDIVGALTRQQDNADDSISGSDVGKIDLNDQRAYVAVNRSIIKQALSLLSEGKMKGRNFRVRVIR